MTLREMAEKEAQNLADMTGKRISCKTAEVADAIEHAARAHARVERRAFAERALRDVVSEWNVVNCGDQEWCDKRIAEAIAAAERGEQ